MFPFYHQIQSFPTPELFINSPLGMAALQQVYAGVDLNPDGIVTPDDITKPAIYYPLQGSIYWSWDTEGEVWVIGSLLQVFYALSDPNIVGLLPVDTTLAAICYIVSSSEASANGGVWVWSPIDLVWVIQVKYVSLVFKLTQSGIDAPIAQYMANELGEVPVFSRIGIGDYRLTVTSGFFSADSLFVLVGNAQLIGSGSTEFVQVSRLSDTVLSIVTTADDVLSGCPFEIRLYV